MSIAITFPPLQKWSDDSGSDELSRNYQDQLDDEVMSPIWAQTAKALRSLELGEQPEGLLRVDCSATAGQRGVLDD